MDDIIRQRVNEVTPSKSAQVRVPSLSEVKKHVDALLHLEEQVTTTIKNPYREPSPPKPVTVPTRRIFGQIHRATHVKTAKNRCARAHVHSTNYLHTAVAFIERLILPIIHAVAPEKPVAQTIVSDVRRLEVVHGGVAPMNYKSVVAYCRKLNMHMPLPKSHLENEMFTTLTANGGDFYLGMTRVSGVWLDKRSMDPLDFAAWAHNQPNNFRGYETATKLRCDGQWNDIHPSAKLQPVCLRVISYEAPEAPNCNYNRVAKAYQCQNYGNITSDDLNLATRKTLVAEAPIQPYVPVQVPDMGKGQGVSLDARIEEAFDILVKLNGNIEILTQAVFMPCLRTHINAWTRLAKKNDPQGIFRFDSYKLIGDKVWLHSLLLLSEQCRMPLTPLRRALMKIPVRFIVSQINSKNAQAAAIALAQKHILHDDLIIDARREEIRVRAILLIAFEELSLSVWARAIDRLDANAPSLIKAHRDSVDSLKKSDYAEARYLANLVKESMFRDENDLEALSRALAFLSKSPSVLAMDPKLFREN